MVFWPDPGGGGGGGGVINRLTKSGSLKAIYTDTLSLICIDSLE